MGLNIDCCFIMVCYVVSSWCVNLIRVFLNDDTLHLLDGLHVS